MKKMIELEEALKAITNNLDRINHTPQGAMYGVAKKWLQDVKVEEIEDEKM